MNAKDFSQMGQDFCRLVLPVQRSELARARAEVVTIETRFRNFERFGRWHQYLANGETSAGMFGGCPTFAMFVKRYIVQPNQKGPARLTDIDLVIVEDVLVEHELRIQIPDPKQPGVTHNIPAVVDISGIIARMVAHGKSASNLSVGSFDEVLLEPCHRCEELAHVVAVDEYQDEDNGYKFQVGRMCHLCNQVDLVATFA